MNYFNFKSLYISRVQMDTIILTSEQDKSYAYKNDNVNERNVNNYHNSSIYSAK